MQGIMSLRRYWEQLLGRKLQYPHANLVDVSRNKRRSQENPDLVPLELLAIKPGQLFSTGTQYADQVRAERLLLGIAVLHTDRDLSTASICPALACVWACMAKQSIDLRSLVKLVHLPTCMPGSASVAACGHASCSRILPPLWCRESVTASGACVRHSAAATLAVLCR